MNDQWRRSAACRGQSGAMFPPEHDEQVRVKRRFCDSCPVKSDCLDFALSTGQEWGVWGNTTEKERLKLVRSRRASIREQRYREENGYQTMFG